VSTAGKRPPLAIGVLMRSSPLGWSRTLLSGRALSSFLLSRPGEGLLAYKTGLTSDAEADIEVGEEAAVLLAVRAVLAERESGRALLVA
jgi:hypothetical protein